MLQSYIFPDHWLYFNVLHWLIFTWSCFHNVTSQISVTHGCPFYMQVWDSAHLLVIVCARALYAYMSDNTYLGIVHSKYVWQESHVLQFLGNIAVLEFSCHNCAGNGACEYHSISEIGVKDMCGQLSSTKPQQSATKRETNRQTSNITRTLVGNKLVDHSDVVGASPFGAAPTTSSFST